MKKKEKEDLLFHNTQLLLEHYRDVVWSLEVSVFQANINFQAEFGSTLEEFLNLSYEAGLDFVESDVASHIKSIEKSRRMLRIIDSAVSLLREKHKYGEVYYWVLYYTYLSPQEMGSINEIMDKLSSYINGISRTSYFRKRNEAVEILGRLLWGYTAKETKQIANQFIGGEDES